MPIVQWAGARPDAEVLEMLSRIDRARLDNFCRGVTADHTVRDGCRLALAVFEGWSFG